MRMVLEHTRNQQRTLRRGHLGDMKRIDYVEVELDGLRWLAVGELEDTQRRPPGRRSRGLRCGVFGVSRAVAGPDAEGAELDAASCCFELSYGLRRFGIGSMTGEPTRCSS
jgi:hypothetical protein